MVNTNSIAGINDASGRNEQLQQLLKQLNVDMTMADNNPMLEYQMGDSAALSAYYSQLQRLANVPGAYSLLSKSDQQNYEKLKFAFDQQKILDQQQSLGGNNARLYQQSGGYANIEFIADKSQLPKDVKDSATDMKYRYDIKKITKDDVTPRVGRIQTAPLNPALVGTYQVTDTKTGTVKYYYVLKNGQKMQNSNAPVSEDEIVDKPKNTKPINKTPSTGVNLKSGGASKPLPTPDLFYSPDYKKLYAKEIQEANMMLLNFAETLLSNYDFETIDSIPSSETKVIYDADGQVIDFDYADESTEIFSQENPIVADRIYAIVEQTLSELRESLVQLPGATSYSELLKSFGHVKSGSQSITTMLPGYEKDGRPYYDLEIYLPDAAGVTGYEIYLVEEDGII